MKILSELLNNVPERGQLHQLIFISLHSFPFEKHLGTNTGVFIEKATYKTKFEQDF